MTTRELFEAEFPVPQGVTWGALTGRWIAVHRDYMEVAGHYQCIWIGFQAGAKRKQCVWARDDDDDSWDTGCRNKFRIEEGSPKENEFEYCCYCGGELVEAGDA